MTDREPAEFSVLERNRAALYRWFARLLFAPLSETDVVALRSGEMRELLCMLAETPGAESGVHTMRHILEQDSAERVAIALNVAHGCLFDGIGGKQTAPLYRSVYTNDSGLLCQQAAAEMDNVLQKHQLQLGADICEPTDHLSIQLELMAQLAMRTADAAEGETTGGSQPGEASRALLVEQAEFLDQQLLDWLPLIATRLSDIDQLSFHAGLASVLLAALRQDRGYLEERLGAGEK